MIQQHQIPLGGQTAQIDIKLLAPFRYFTGHLGNQRSALLIIHALGRFIQVIHYYDADGQLFFLIPLTQDHQLSNIV
ncbi:hypothetical protein D3C81_2194080 [compost metagenome]